MKHMQGFFRVSALGGMLTGLWGVALAWALPPAPANDTPATAQVITDPLPAFIEGTTVLADNSISTTVLPAPANDVDGPDVFYSYTPATTGTYRVHLWPWQRAPLRSSDRQFIVYVLDNTMTAIAGVRAPGSARPLSFNANLTSGLTYLIAVDHNDATTLDNFQFTLALDLLDLNNPDTCALVEDLSGALPVVRLNSIDGAQHHYSFTQGTGRCGVATTTITPGNDHVYKFTPAVAGDYAVELIADLFDGVIYVNTSCDPVFPGGCLGASNNGGGSTAARHELVVVTLEAGVDYYIFVDNGSTTAITGAYALVIDEAFNYEINEIEPNDSPATASTLETPLNGGQLVGPTDQDYWAVTGSTGDRVYAWVNNGGASNSTLDTNLGFYAADGTTLIEYDDEDGDGAAAPINDWHFVYSTTAATIAGARLTSNGTHYWLVTDASATGVVSRYRFHTGIIPATRSPLAECEPNGSLASADYSGKHYYSGVIDTVTDKDVFAIEVQAGDRVFIAFDGDPERDANGTDPANTDPNGFHGKLVVYDPAGDILISDISDANNSTNPPDYPAQAGFFIARTTGTHYIEVGPQSTSSQVGPTETYELAVFLNEAAPALAEDVDPTLVLTPDYNTNTIAGVAEDLGSDVCDVALIDATNLQITNLSGLPTTTATFDVELVNGAQNGFGKLVVTDCEGNTTCEVVVIDVTLPVCAGQNFGVRTLHYTGDPIFVPDNDANGVESILTVPDAGVVSDVNVTVTFETTSVQDLDVFLIAPDGTTFELFTDRGSSSSFNVIDATFDDSATALMSLLSSGEPFTGTWLPEGAGGLATFNGHAALGNWRLKVADDSSSESGGSRLVRWTLEVTASYAAPQSFAGQASDNATFDDGIASIVLTGDTNVSLVLPPGFAPGDPVVNYTVELIDPEQNGSATVVVTDMQGNTCASVVALAGLADVTAPANSGANTTDLRLKQEVQLSIPSADPAGVVATLPVYESYTVGEVEVDLVIDTRDLGRLAATLTKGSEFVSLVNRVGMTERQSVGLTKNTIDITLDDDAPVADDAHLEPALGTIAFRGLHQPDGRGEFVGDGINSDLRDNMLLNLAGLNTFGGWKLQAADYRLLGTTRSELRRWAVTIKSPCAGERYVGRATDFAPGLGIASLAFAPGAVNLALEAEYTAGDEVVDYRVELVDRSQPGSGTLLITDGASNQTPVAISLAAAAADQNLPVAAGSVNPATDEFEGTATDNQAGDSGIVDVALLPYATNLQLVSVTPGLPAGSVDFVVGLVNPAQNGHGYVRVTDACGWRTSVLIAIDAADPICTGSIGHTKRYLSTDLPLPIPDNNVAGAVSSIVVTDTDIVSDVNLTLNITHGFDADIDATLTSPLNIPLFSDLGSTANDFTDTTLDDEAPTPIPDNAAMAPFTGSWQPEGGPALLLLDGVPAAATYSLKIADDKTNDFGVFQSWSLTIESPTFPLRYDGRVQDAETLATGVCAIELLPGAFNLTLVADPFTPGAHIVRYSVELTDPDLSGGGYVRATDCGGNVCDTPISMLGALGVGDMNCDGSINFGDINPFVLYLSNFSAWQAAYPGCPSLNGDINGDGTYPSFGDINPFVALLSQ